MDRPRRRRTPEHTLIESPVARISVVQVTTTSDPPGILGDHDPAECMVPSCGVELYEAMPNERLFDRA